jgi:predicted dehydrogenase
MTISVGIIGTSWWADAMYLPALKQSPYAEVTAVCGRNPDNTKQFAEKWQIPHIYTDYNQLIESGLVEAVIVSTSNESHYAITMKALEKGLHVLCEKPLGLNYVEAKQMADLAEQRGVKHLTPFTYSYVPTTRYLKELISGGYIGKPYHLNMRYYAGYGRNGDYMWRFDVAKGGAGAVADIGSHFMYIAYWLYGNVTSVCCQLGQFAERTPIDNDGKPYERGDENAVVMLQFENGAQGVIHVSTMCYEGTPFGQTHHMEFHGSEGTLYSVTDWDKIQQVSGARVDEGAPKEMAIPDHIWAGARRGNVQDTYKDIFREQDLMARQFVKGIAENTPMKPDFHDGAYIQRLIDAAVKSARERCWVDVASIT